MDEEEIWEAIATLKMEKAAGNDGITPEMIKKLGSQGMKMLHATPFKCGLEGKEDSERL